MQENAIEKYSKDQEKIKVIYNESQSLLKEVSNLNKKCIDENIKPFSAKKHKLIQIYNEIQKQFLVIKNLIASFKERNNSIIKNVQETNSHYVKFVSDLKLVLKLLQEKEIHPLLQGKNMENTIEKKFLYDYVNIESVDSLLLQAEQEISALNIILEKTSSILKSINDQHDEISKVNDLMSQDLEILVIETSEESFNKEPMNQIINLSLEIAGYYDKINYIISNAHLFQSLKYEPRDFSGHITKIKKEIETVNLNCNNVKEKFKLMAKISLNAQNCFIELEKISPMLPSKFQDLGQMEDHFNLRTSQIKPLFEEIQDLTSWYRLFMQSCDNLILEIDRRNREILKLEKFNTEITKKYNDMYNGIFDSY